MLSFLVNMTRNERTLNSYALRNAILLAVYGLYSIFILPFLYYPVFMTHIRSTMGFVVFLLIGIRAISYIWIGFSGMLTPEAIRKNHQSLNVCLFLFMIINLYIGVYLSVKDGLQTSQITALSLSSLLIAAVMVYYFTLFQLRESCPTALRTMTASLLFFSGGGEIFFHQIPYANTIMGWFMIWMSLNGPNRALWKSFIFSIIGSLCFYLPRFMLTSLKNFLIENEITPLSFIYVSFGVILIVIAVLLKIKTREFPVERSKGASTNTAEVVGNK